MPGTSFIAKSGSAGEFSLSGLPEGSYTMKLQHTGFATITITNVNVISGEDTDIGSIPLSLSNGPEGSISISEDINEMIQGHSRKIKRSRTIQINLSYDSEAALMKISDEPTFLNTSWEEVKSTYSWTFNSDGFKSIYVQYSDLNGLESSPYLDEVYIDTENPEISRITIMI